MIHIFQTLSYTVCRVEALVYDDHWSKSEVKVIKEKI